MQTKLSDAEKEVLDNSMGPDLDELGKTLGLARQKGFRESESLESDDDYRARLKAWTEMPFPTLTEREREVAQHLILGKPNRAIAYELSISIKTVDTHRGHVMKKLDVANNVELLRLAIRMGWHVVQLEADLS